MRDSNRPSWRRALCAVLVWAALFPGWLASRRPLTGQQPRGEAAVPTGAGSTGDRSQPWSFRPAVRPELPAVPVTSCTYAARAPLSERERKGKEALDRELDKQQSKSYVAEVHRLAKEYWAAKQAGNDQSVVLIKAKQAEVRRPINELDRKLQPYRTTGYKSHGWVWFYRQEPKRDVDLAQEVLSVPRATTGANAEWVVGGDCQIVHGTCGRGGDRPIFPAICFSSPAGADIVERGRPMVPWPRRARDSAIDIVFGNPIVSR